MKCLLKALNEKTRMLHKRLDYETGLRKTI